MNPAIDDTEESEKLAAELKKIDEFFKESWREHASMNAKELAADMQMVIADEIDMYVQTATGAAYSIWRK